MTEREDGSSSVGQEGVTRETHNTDGSNLGLGVPATVLGSLGMTKSGNWPGPGLALLPGLLVTHYCYRLQPQRYLVPRYLWQFGPCSPPQQTCASILDKAVVIQDIEG